MTDNPYKPPEAEVESKKEISEIEAKKLKSLASGQKLIIYAILVYFLAFAAGQVSPIVAMVLVFASFALSVVGLLKVLVLLNVHIVFKILYFLLLFLPLLNILALLSINARATKMLRKGGYKVGLLGAKPVNV